MSLESQTFRASIPENSYEGAGLNEGQELLFALVILFCLLWEEEGNEILENNLLILKSFRSLQITEAMGWHHCTFCIKNCSKLERHLTHHLFIPDLKIPLWFKWNNPRIFPRQWKTVQNFCFYPDIGVTMCSCCLMRLKHSQMLFIIQPPGLAARMASSCPFTPESV